jgi:uncharacterized membrane protein YhiD involved in acid resistance
MGEISAFIGLIKDVPTTITSIIAILAVIVTVWLRARDTDIMGATSISKSQNERLNTLMDQNGKLLDSVAKLQEQVTELHAQMSIDADDHRVKMEQMYRVTDDMRKRIMELEDLVRHYQNGCDNCPSRVISIKQV